MSQVLRVAVYRFRATFGHRWSGYLSVVLLIGLIGGVAMASIAAGRRTQSSYPAFLARTDPSDLTVSVGSDSPGPSSPSAALMAAIARLPGVRRVGSLITPAIVPLTASGAPAVSGRQASSVQFVGHTDGMFLSRDRVSVIDGRMADPNRPTKR